MKQRFLFAIIVLASVVNSCMYKEVQTDLWESSMVLRSKPSDEKDDHPKTSTRSGLCSLRYDKDNFYVDIESNHSSLTIVSIDCDMLTTEAKKKYGPGTTLSVEGGVCTLEFKKEELSIDKTSAHRFSITIRDDLSGQEREFSNYVYTYENFFLAVQFYEYKQGEGNSVAWEVYENTTGENFKLHGGTNVKYRIVSDQPSIVIKECKWELNNYAEGDNQLKPGKRIQLAKMNSSQYYKDFDIMAKNNNIYQTMDGNQHGDQKNLTFSVTAYGDDYNTSFEQTASVKYDRFYNTELKMWLSQTSDDTLPLNEENGVCTLDETQTWLLEKGKRVYLHVYFNRPNQDECELTVEGAYSTPNILTTTSNMKKAWFEALTEKGAEIKIKTPDGRTHYQISGTEGILTNEHIPSDYREESWDGTIEIQLKTTLPNRIWNKKIKYQVNEKTQKGPALIKVSDFKMIEIANDKIETTALDDADTSNFHFNQGEIYAARIRVDKVNELAPDGHIQVLNPSSDGAVDFCLATYESDKSWRLYSSEGVNLGAISAENAENCFNDPDDLKVSCSDLTDNNKEIYILMRALDRGGKAHVRLSATIAHDDGKKATFDICPYVRHRAAIFVGGTFTAKINPLPTGFFKRSDSAPYGWTGYPTQMYATLACYGLANNNEPSNIDPCDFNMEKATTLTKGSIKLKECPVAVSIKPKFTVGFTSFNDWKYYGNCHYGNLNCLIEQAQNVTTRHKGRISEDEDFYPAPYCVLPIDHEENDKHGTLNSKIKEFLGGEVKLNNNVTNADDPPYYSSPWINSGIEDCSIQPSYSYTIDDFTVKSFDGNQDTKRHQSDKFKWLMLYWCNNCVYYQVYGIYGGTYPAPNRPKVGTVAITCNLSSIEEQLKHNDVEIRHIIYTFDWSANDPFSYSEYTSGASYPWWHANYSTKNPTYIQHIKK